MSILLYGRWHLEVTKAIHNWENRYVIEGASSGSGTYPPTVGSDVTVDGAVWQLRGEYRKSDADPWKPSDMMIDTGVERVDIQATIGSEDPLPSRDFEDIQWAGRYLGSTMLEVPSRPYAVRMDDLFQMPDGIFETALGTYYMAVQVTNRWGLPFTEDHVLDITPESRAAMMIRGITVIDAWSQSELSSLGQSQSGSGMVIGALAPGNRRTVYFKVDVTNAAPRKHEIEFVCWNMSGMVDPNHSARRVRKNIFVSRTSIDNTAGEIVAEVQEGTLRMKLKEIAFDQKTARAGRKKRPTTHTRSDDAVTLDTLRRTLEALLKGKKVDPCLIQRILTCYCACRGGGVGGDDPRNPGDGRFTYEPFYIIPTKFSYTIIPRDPFAGQYGPLPYDDPWWKVLLLIIAGILLLAGMLSEGADVAYQDEDLVIGTLGDFQRDDVDAALCMLDTDRALSFDQVLDAQSNEDLQNAIVALNDNVNLNGPVMTQAEIGAILLTTGVNDPQRQVFKSGARTGLTHAIMTGLAPTGHSLATWNINQLVLGTDPAFGEPVSRGGDSGSIWVHTQTLRPVALHHSGNDADTSGNASLLEDVQNVLGITI